MKTIYYREIINVEDPDTCFCCQRWFSKIDVHHMDGNHNNNCKENLIKVCKRCHAFIHKGVYKKVPEIFNNETMRRIGSLRKYLLRKKKVKLPDPKNDFTIKAIQPIYL